MKRILGFIFASLLLLVVFSPQVYAADVGPPGISTFINVNENPIDCPFVFNVAMMPEKIAVPGEGCIEDPGDMLPSDYGYYLSAGFNYYKLMTTCVRSIHYSLHGYSIWN